ncbi:hypothetical protein QFC22_000633 [Naganishia vaughanmartiniae]|uniref:Uncharacterized protein n=1 Tax=Naganishia vaughanmartiniae TaxID=1424756 RepID=A0ACC2XQL5_9TREE|nr:hypothetical protein QFC22_000633 [Naganishia vaughanmartiniae]
MSLLSSLGHSVGIANHDHAPAVPSSDALSTIPPPPELPQPLRLLIALSTLSATTYNPLYPFLPPAYRSSWRSMASEWSTAVHRLLQLDPARLPATVPLAEQVAPAARAYWDDMEAQEREEEQSKVVLLLLLASVFQPPTEGEDVKMVDVTAEKEALGTTATTHANNLERIQPPSTDKVPTLSYTPPARQLIYTTLHLLQIPTTPTLSHTESSLAKSLFTALQQSSSSSTTHASVESTRAQHADGWGGSTGRWLATATGAVIGGVAIGLTGGLAAPAIAALVPSFMTFGLLTTASAPLVLGSVFGLAGGGLTSRRVRERWRGVEEFEFVDVKVGSEVVKEDDGEKSRSASVEPSPLVKQDEFEKASIDEKRNSVDKVQEKVPVAKGTAPSLIVRSFLQPKPKLAHSLTSRRKKATIIVPGLLTKSRTEALTAWQSHIIPSSPSLQDGRDIFVLKYETKRMLQTGQAIDAWVTQKVKGYVKKEIIKRTVLSAYFTAVALPLSVYNMASLGLDNTWVQAQDKAIKAGRLLGEVLENRVQGQRPVVLIGSSLGALTVLHALLYLASRTKSNALPQIVDSAFLISLPSAPTGEEWQACRQVVARRVVNAWCEKDLVLAGIVRLHEVFSRAVTLQNGVHVAGLRPVNQPGIEDVDLTDVVEGHLDLQRQMGEVLRVLRIDE